MKKAGDLLLNTHLGVPGTSMWRYLVGKWKMGRSSHHPDWGKDWNGFKKGYGG